MEASVKNPVRKLRKQKGLTQGDLAILLGVSVPFVSQVELGVLAPSETMLQRLANILQIEAEKLDQNLVSFHEKRKQELQERLGLRMSRK